MSEESKGKSWSFPSTYTILVIALIFVAGLTYIIPAGSYDYQDPMGQIIPAEEASLMSADERKALKLSPIAGTFTRMESRGQIKHLPMAPIKGFADSVEVATFVLFIGGFLGVIAKTRAIDVGIASLMTRMRSRLYLLMAMLISIFSLGGMSYGMGEETIAFYPILLPMMVAAGFDVMAAAAVILLGAGTGVLTSVLNPFATGVASDLAGVSIGDGMPFRLVQWALFAFFTMFYVIRYAKRTQKSPMLSVTHDLNPEINAEILANHQEHAEKLTLRQTLVLITFIATFGVMVFSLLPFSDWNENLASLELGWYFPELAALFLSSSILVGFLAGFNERDIAGSFVAGAKDVLGVVLVLVLSRGLKVVMEEGMIIDSILAFSEQAVQGLPQVVYINVVYFLHIILSIFIPSTSGLAGLSMPIMAPLADIAGVSKSLVITAYQSASGLVNMVSPTSGILMGALMVSKIPYDRFIKFVWKYIATLFVATMVLLTLGVLLGVG
ncbi:YfcC family protein [Entomospira culicis]|uniref:YfcC family protein n=1 Tax=Entomospira culicis TaxID=2719989 RepID=A0A968GJ89_9SPIO|nr:YfcC family protein [Entomospira culicis]NIZ19405.1 YfcC family protein [Entomospira culicis]NIZ69690.1 YfcC family protein [Entomospira culicis]WDI36800.1 YfcC family protein [Entomospira culicis]WDI38429.1 YfcC family protein [Entomospira culicis]